MFSIKMSNEFIKYFTLLYSILILRYLVKKVLCPLPQLVYLIIWQHFPYFAFIRSIDFRNEALRVHSIDKLCCVRPRRRHLTMAFINFSVILIVASLSGFARGQRTPTISHITQKQIKDIGGQVDLACSVHYASDYPVLWLKYDQHSEALPISTKSSLIFKDSRMSMRYDEASSTYTLSIKDIQETDAGTYQCKVIISSVSKVSAEVELLVRRAPIISDNSTQSIVANEKDSVEMECHAGGFPTPKISWRRENNAVLPTGGSIYIGNVLKIVSVQKEDRGTYYCVADNGVGKGARRNINLEVEFAPIITVPRPRLGQALQYDMNLECHIEAYPPPGIIWLKDEVQLTNNQHYMISHFTTDEYTDTTLRVITIEKRQYGRFSCKAQNKLGSSEGHVELFETTVPDINFAGLVEPLTSSANSSVLLYLKHVMFYISLSTIIILMVDIDILLYLDDLYDLY